MTLATLQKAGSHISPNTTTSSLKKSTALPIALMLVGGDEVHPMQASKIAWAKFTTKPEFPYSLCFSFAISISVINFIKIYAITKHRHSFHKRTIKAAGLSMSSRSGSHTVIWLILCNTAVV